MTELTRRKPNIVLDNPREAQRRSAEVRRKEAEEARARLEAKLDEALEPAAKAYVDALGADKSDEADHSVRIAAADRITNRRLGMPAASVHHSGQIDVDVSVARDRLAALLDRRALGQGDGT